MSKMFETAEAEKHAFNEEESKKSDEMMTKVKELDATIKKAEELRALEKRQADNDNKEPEPADNNDDKAKADDTEIRAFLERECLIGTSGKWKLAILLFSTVITVACTQNLLRMSAFRCLLRSTLMSTLSALLHGLSVILRLSSLRSWQY